MDIQKVIQTFQSLAQNMRHSAREILNQEKLALQKLSPLSMEQAKDKILQLDWRIGTINQYGRPPILVALIEDNERIIIERALKLAVGIEPEFSAPSQFSVIGNFGQDKPSPQDAPTINVYKPEAITKLHAFLTANNRELQLLEEAGLKDQERRNLSAAKGKLLMMCSL